MQITEGQNKAAGSIVDLINNTIGNNGEIHAATAISACGRLAGSFMLRSFNLKMDNISPGNVMLSEQANEKGPILINVLGAVLNDFGVIPDPNKMNKATNEKSNLSFLETLERLQDQAQAIMVQNDITQEQMAYSCAMATGYFIKECQKDLPAETGFHTGVYAFIEGSKTWPPNYSEPELK